MQIEDEKLIGKRHSFHGNFANENLNSSDNEIIKYETRKKPANVLLMSGVSFFLFCVIEAASRRRKSNCLIFLVFPS
jgi:hypothetical protein